jgi:hypothetical protein
MKLFIKFSAFALLICMLFYIACKKETSCEGCRDGNKPPTAIAGPDQVITLPTDSILLDGWSSSDPDGTISDWLWTKIEGPVSFAINNPTASKTVIKNLSAGIYHFEKNKPPISNAGPDQGNHFTT